jgi:ABC-type multidrug transport system fused ATPase/permease subunit
MLVVGRECEGLVLDDPTVSRRHIVLRSVDGDLTATDAGSSNGTFVNGAAIDRETTLHDGDRVKLGDVTLVVIEGSPPAAAADRARATEFETKRADSAEIRYRRGTVGEQHAPAVARAARRARRALTGFGSQPWAGPLQVYLVDPFPDPERPGALVAEGTFVDPARGHIWMVVTAESPPEPLERPMAVLLGAALPAARDLDFLVEGYGSHLARVPDPDPQLAQFDLPPLEAADGELRAAMALSLVRFMVEQGGDEDFRRLLTTAVPGRVDATAQEIYGMSLAAIDEAWRQHVSSGPPDVKTGRFLRLAASYVRPYARREAEMGVYMVLGLVFTVVLPFATRRLFDKAIPSHQLSQVVSILAVLGVAFVLSLLADLRRAFLSAYVSSAVVREVRTKMFTHLQRLSARWFNQHQQGDIVSRLFSDVGLLEAGLSQALREGAFQVLSLVVSAVVLVILNPLLAAIVLLGAPLVGVVYRVMGSGARKRSLAVQEHTGAVVQVAAENYGAQPVVKAFALERREGTRFSQASDRLFSREVALQLFGGLFSVSVNMIVTILRLLVLGIGAWLILHHHLTVGGLVAFIGLMGEVITPVTVLTGIGQQIQASTGALIRINQVLDTEPEVADVADAVDLPRLQRDISLTGVGFSYTPERRALDDVTVMIPAGARVAFVGPTGAGKSSILQLLMRFYDPDAGAVLFDGQDIRGATVASVRGQLGVVFQDTFLFDASVRDNIALGRPDATDDEIRAAAQGAALDEFVTTLPRGYDTMVGERGGRLSGGQRQRLAIARALLRDPAVLLLDEATSALDPRTERMIAETLAEVGRGRTTIAVTHRLTSVVGYDRVFVVVDGRVAEEGTHRDLLDRGGVYANLWAEQTGGVVATEPPFDALGALARLPLFAGLAPDELAHVAGRLRAGRLQAGEGLPEGGGRLVLVRRGRARVLTPGLDGTLVPSAEIGPGDAFGLSALLGDETGAVLEGAEDLAILVLDDEDMAALAATLPSVGAALVGRRAESVAVDGRRLARLTFGPTVGEGPLSPAVSVPDEAQVRRLTGSMPAVRR